MGHKELKEIGINAYGHRHKIIKGVERLISGQQGIYRCFELLCHTAFIESIFINALDYLKLYLFKKNL